MILTDILRIVIAIVYLMVFLFADRIQRLAYEVESYDDKLMINEAGLQRVGFRYPLVFFFVPIGLSIFVNDISFSRNGLYIWIGNIVVASVIVFGLSRSGYFQKQKAEQEHIKLISQSLPLQYRQAERRANQIRIVAAVTLFLYLIIV